MANPAPVIRIDPKAIQAGSTRPKAGPSDLSKTKATGSFNAYMGSVNAMGPFASELTYQTSGNVNAATVLSAAFSSFPAAASAFAGQGGVPSYAAGYSPYGGTVTDQQIPGLAGGPGMMRAAYTGNYGAIGTGDPNAPVTPDVPGFSQAELMETMNRNNLQLLELQAIMQSNMQQWTTKSNVLSADHRAKMSIVEKFSARG